MARPELTPEQKRQVIAGAVLALMVFVYLSAGLTYVEAERLNIDEGWILYASKLVMRGQLPYVDFMYVQPPVQPYLYGLFGGHRSVRAGRLVSLGCGLICLLAVAVAVWKLEGWEGGLMAAALLGLTPFVLSWFSVVKTYAGVGMFLALGLLALATGPERRRSYVLAALAFTLAVGMRNSAAVALFGLLLYLAVFRRDRWDFFLSALLTTTLASGLIFGPFLGLDPQAFFFDTYTHHIEWTEHVGWGGTALGVFVSLCHFARLNGPLFILLVAAGATWVAHRPPEDRPGSSVYGLALGLLGLLFLVNFTLGTPLVEYQAFLLVPAVFLAAGGAARFYRRMPAGPGRTFMAWTLLVLVGVAPLLHLPPTLTELPALNSGPRGAGSLGNLREIAAFVRQHSAPGDEIFTFQPFVAIDAQRDLCPGTEVATFSFYPGWSDERTQRLHALNLNLAEEYLATRRPALAVLSGGDLVRMQGQVEQGEIKYTGRVLQALARNYRLARVFKDAGQFREEFYVFLPRAAGDESS